MLLEKLNGTVPCLLDTSTIPPEELSLKPSRSGADSGICEGPGGGGGGARHSNGEPSSSSVGHPYNRTFSPHFHAFVGLCLQRDPEKRYDDPLTSSRSCDQLPHLFSCSDYLPIFFFQTFSVSAHRSSLLQTGE